jgi:hypothetical protein
MVLLGSGVALLGGWSMWNNLVFAFEGQAASGRVLEFHHVASRNASIVGQVEVAMAGRAPFRAEVDDSLGSQEWAVGNTVSLRCAQIHGPGYMSCSADSGIAHLLFSLLFIGGGFGLVWLAANKMRAKRE